MRILLDTNIIIPLEDSANILDDSFSKLVKLSHANSHPILIHPRTPDDINRDKNTGRRSSILSRLKKYEKLENVETFSDSFLLEKGIGDKKDNDNVDNAMLAAVYNNAVHLLITEDQGIHKKAIKLDISDRVMYVQQIVDVLERLHPIEVRVAPPNLQDVSLHSLNIKDAFFDSLREDYDGFDKWFLNSAADGRKAWINREINAKEITAILIYKSEEKEPITIDHRALPNKSIKISTFKVGEQVRGKKIGELLFKTVFEYAVKNKYAWVYLTVHPEKHDFLKDLCIDLGFYFYGIDIKSNRDEVYVKQIGLQDPVQTVKDAFEFYRKYSPSILCNESQKYIIPIQPVYHEILFPELQRQRVLYLDDNTPGNTIKKAYLSHAQIKKVQTGDLVLFYRSDDEKRLTTLAIVEACFISDDPEYIASRVAKRTVYTYNDIQRMSKKKTNIILFRQITHFNTNINFQWMRQEDIVKGNIQSIRSISDKAFNKIMEKENAKNCVIID